MHMNNSKYIGIFDSGVGGLTTVRELNKQMPNENIVFLADYKHMPYGDKTSEQIKQYVLNDVEYLNNYPLKAIVIACNTADSVALNAVKDKYDIPVFGVIDATAKTAATTTKNNRIGVIATTATTNSNEYKKQINKYNPNALVISKATPFLAPLIEEGKFNFDNNQIRIILQDYIDPLIQDDIDTLVLGCTHYDLLDEIIKDLYPNLNIVSSSKCVIKTIKNKLEPNDSNFCEKLYFVTSNKDKFEEIANLFMDNIIFQEI